MSRVARLVVTGLTLAASAVVLPLAPAAPAQATYGTCMDYLVVEQGVDPWLANSACDQGAEGEFLDCYQELRAHYVPAVVAATGCRMAAEEVDEDE